MYDLFSKAPYVFNFESYCSSTVSIICMDLLISNTIGLSLPYCNVQSKMLMLATTLKTELINVLHDNSQYN